MGLLSALGFGSDAGDYAAQMAKLDPFSKYRAGMADQLNQLMVNPESIVNDPGYLWSLSQGEQGLLRQQAATGGAGSGMEKIALQQYDQGFAGNYLQQKIQQLAGLSNALHGPQEMAAGITGAEQLKQQQGSNLLGTLGTVAGGVIGFMYGGPAGAAAGASVGSKL